MVDKKKILYNGMLGLVIGDALGVPAEFMHREVLKKKPITGMVSGGVWRQPAGTWSDDTAMALATIDALNRVNWKEDEQLYDLIMQNFVDWYLRGKFAANHNRYDIGNTCESAINRYMQYKDPETCGMGEGKHGNGSLMRILPAMFLSDDAVLNIGRLTHNNKVCDTAIIAYVHYARELANGKDKKEALTVLLDVLRDCEEYESVINRLFKGTTEDRILSTGYVVDTLEAAVWCFLNTDNYKDCVLKAVNLGEDTDTVAAVAGGLAGIYYGMYTDNIKRGIPEEFVKSIRDIETFNDILRAAQKMLN